MKHLRVPPDRMAELAARLAGPPFLQPPSPLEDPELPHQIISLQTPGGLAVTCNCLRQPGPAGGKRGMPRQLIAVRGSAVPFPVAEALAAWRGWHEQRGVSV